MKNKHSQGFQVRLKNNPIEKRLKNHPMKKSKVFSKTKAAIQEKLSVKKLIKYLATSFQL